MKLLLYCTKAKPYIAYQDIDYDCDDNCCSFMGYLPFTRQELYDYDISLDKTLNGKIVAECDFEVEDIFNSKIEENMDNWYSGINLIGNDLLKESCLSIEQLDIYLKGNYGYAIYIKNLHIFDEARELSEYYKIDSTITLREAINRTKPVYIPINKAPHSMMYCFEDDGNHLQQNILISIKPEWMCKILNDEKTIEVRKKVLKGMI